MTLSLIWGPPNAGRVGEVLREFRARLADDPVLVVPNADDAELFETELVEDGAILGGTVSTFGGLVGEVARALDFPWGPGLTRPQSVWVARLATRRTELTALRGSASRPGFAPALAELVDEQLAAGIDAVTFASHAQSGTETDRELARLFAAREEVRAERGIADRHELARGITTALRGNPDAWGRRPVFIYGFDELTRQQLELVQALTRAADVTVAVTYEDRTSLAARATLLSELRELVPPGEIAGEVELEADPDTTPDPTLFHLERGFLEPGVERIEPGDGLTLLRAAGERNEAELVGAEVAKLLAAGAEPEEIAIVLRSPARSGALWLDVLSGLGVPAAIEATAPLTATATGRGMLALARLIGTDGTADDLVAYLRTPGRAPGGKVDRLERVVRRDGLRSAAAAERAWAELDGRRLFELDDLREEGSGGSLLERAAATAKKIAEYPIRDLGEVPPPRRALELKGAAEAARALSEVAALGAGDAGPAELEEILAEVRVRLHQGAVHGRVRVVSPYRLRARRVKHLFVASLQDGVFPRRDPGSPLLGDERRRELGLPERAAADEEERYLFAVCLSRPERGLALSWRYADDEGRALARSPFVDDVRDLLSPEQPEDPEDPDPLFELIGRERGPADVVSAPADSPSRRELARSVAAEGRAGWPALVDRLEMSAEAEASLRDALATAAETTDPARAAPKDLHAPEVLEALGAVSLFGASTLEAYEECSYRWFVGHELRPRRIEPTDEPLVLGGLAHRALEELYRDRPGGVPRPTPDTLDEWRARARELVERHAADSDLPASDPVALAQIRRVEGLLNAHLADEAAASRVLQPDPDLLEASFGEGEGNQRPPLDLGNLRLHGQIDRVDVAEGPAGRVGLITDYKLSRQVTPAAKLKDEGKLQLQLYSLALRRLWGIEPAGGVYLPLRGTDTRRPRGLMDAQYADQLAGFGTYGNDVLDTEQFAEALESAEGAASRIADAIHRGRIRRDPPDNQCPRYCRFQTICRRERGMEEEDDLPEEEDEP